ncbi:hypothetical protein SAMN06265795_102250 [Noviherbaspirillum humi]|uniref:Uncharacterized protein n=1 Tax=Noviherbaspirillum humi TaxID=1688639 RepID=A0A239DM79_9BURK|nr:hypothetical protein [Noviherbaspirillum humi]SNS33181.1 hypothetical protein SAMN06265795_102250 [Noviherbaspirillum humi]
MQLVVESRPGLHGDPDPASFQLGGRQIDVVSIIDRWRAPDHAYFKVRGSDDALYILRLDSGSGLWELTLFKAPGMP